MSNVSANNGAVHAPYYGIAFVADALGPNTSTETRVTELANSSDTKITAYAFYSGQKLSKIAVLNLDVWVSSTGSGSRPAKQVELVIPASVDVSAGVKVEKLTGKDSFDQFGITWAGEKFTFKSHGLPEQVRDDTKTVQAEGQKVTININATEALLLTF